MSVIYRTIFEIEQSATVDEVARPSQTGSAPRGFARPSRSIFLRNRLRLFTICTGSDEVTASTSAGCFSSRSRPAPIYSPTNKNASPPTRPHSMAPELNVSLHELGLRNRSVVTLGCCDPVRAYSLAAHSIAHRSSEAIEAPKVFPQSVSVYRPAGSLTIRPAVDSSSRRS